VLSALFWAWLLLAELPRPVQMVGGALIVAGVVLVKMGERDTSEHAGVSARPDA
jgi:drug/metabolite transporter (DMT)-like permease